jgi:hypothetical protein
MIVNKIKGGGFVLSPEGGSVDGNTSGPADARRRNCASQGIPTGATSALPITLSDWL